MAWRCAIDRLSSFNFYGKHCTGNSGCKEVDQQPEKCFCWSDKYSVLSVVEVVYARIASSNW